MKILVARYFPVKYGFSYRMYLKRPLSFKIIMLGVSTCSLPWFKTNLERNSLKLPLELDGLNTYLHYMVVLLGKVNTVHINNSSDLDLKFSKVP